MKKKTKLLIAMRDPAFIFLTMLFLLFLLVTLLELKPGSIPYAIFYSIFSGVSLIALVIRYTKLRG